MPRRRTRVATIAAAAVVLATLSSCASAEDTEPDDAATATSTDTSSASDGGSASTPSKPTGVVVDITFNGDSVTPNGERVDAKVGQPVTLNIDADAPGELHVHSTPEQEIAYDAGTSTHEVTFDLPGIVDVESHDLEKIVVQVEVR